MDTTNVILDSLKKTHKLLIVDEDVPGGASAYILQHVLENQGGFNWLDLMPRTLTAQPHRGSYSADGDYFSKPNRDSILKTLYEIMNTYNPKQHRL